MTNLKLLRQFIREAAPSVGMGRIYLDRSGTSMVNVEDEAPHPQPEDGSEPTHIEGFPEYAEPPPPIDEAPIMPVNIATATLDDASHNELVKLMKKSFPKHCASWVISAHHVTICMKPQLPKDDPLLISLGALVGRKVAFRVVQVGYDESVCAAKVRIEDLELWAIMKELTAFQTLPKFPHVTIAINVDEGGKPVDSNFITEWKQIKGPKLEAIIEAKVPSLQEHGKRLNTDTLGE